jgi:hypothetical protein
MIQVEQRNGAGLRGAPRAVQTLHQFFVPRAPVRQAGQHIDAGNLGEPFHELLTLGERMAQGVCKEQRDQQRKRAERDERPSGALGRGSRILGRAHGALRTVASSARMPSAISRASGAATSRTLVLAASSSSRVPRRMSAVISPCTWSNWSTCWRTVA